jgi:hypothetical protein
MDPLYDEEYDASGAHSRKYELKSLDLNWKKNLMQIRHLGVDVKYGFRC